MYQILNDLIHIKSAVFEISLFIYFVFYIKVADCVCLMSMDKAGAIPVDTHVWQIAARDYIPKLKQSKSLTDNLYKEIGREKKHDILFVSIS